MDRCRFSPLIVSVRPLVRVREGLDELDVVGGAERALVVRREGAHLARRDRARERHPLERGRRVLGLHDVRGRKGLPTLRGRGGSSAGLARGG